MFILLTTCFNKIGNYTERGNPIRHELVNGSEVAILNLNYDQLTKDNEQKLKLDNKIIIEFIKSNK